MGFLCWAVALLLVAVLLVVYWQQSVHGQSAQQRQRATSTKSAITCTTPKHRPGDSTETLVSGGINRSFLVHLAPSYGKNPQSLVLNYHGYTGTAQGHERGTHMDKVADTSSFVVVFPQGIDSPSTWSAGVGAYGPTGDADDVQFTRDMLDYLEKNYCIDAQHVYVTGFSLGGGMAYRIACELSNQIAAVATVAGAYYPFGNGCHPARPLPVMEIHGAADRDAPYDGNTFRRMAAVQDYLNTWFAIDQCDKTGHVFFQQGDVTGTEWTHCTPGTEVCHYRVSDGLHAWPGSGNATQVIDASKVIWDFFNKFSLPSSSISKTSSATP